MGQNALSYSECGIFKWDIFLEQIEEISSFSADWYKFMLEVIESFWLGVVKNRHVHSGHWTLILNELLQKQNTWKNVFGAMPKMKRKKEGHYEETIIQVWSEEFDLNKEEVIDQIEEGYRQ